MRPIRLLFLLLVASSVLASPVITSVTPAEGAVEGGTVVTITGTGFSDNCIVCSPPFGGLSVFFGNVQATGVRLIDATKVEVTAPAHQRGPVPIRIRQLDGSSPDSFTLPNAFTYLAEWGDDLDPVLFPIFMPPVHGAFGSEFRTTVHVAGRLEPIELFGVDTTCTLIDPPLPPTNAYVVGTKSQLLMTRCSESVGRLFYVPRERARQLVANVRVADVSRQGEGHGVEVPVVREEEFVTDRLVLQGVPADPRYRSTLRIYGLDRPTASKKLEVSWNGVRTTVTLEPGRDAFEPWYAELTLAPAQLPTGQDSGTVIVEDAFWGRGFAGATPFWAFVSVTNNDTQQITLVTPN